MREDEKILDKLKKVLGEDIVAGMSAEDLKPFLDNPEVLGSFAAFAPVAEEKAVVKSFEDYCPDMMKNPVTAQWIEKEGDKARVFAVKMAGIADNPKVNAEVKQMIASPEGLVDLYNRLDAKAAHVEEIEQHYMQNLTNVEELEKIKDDLLNPKNQEYTILMKNDQVVLTTGNHWEQCYSMGKGSQQTTLDVLAEEAQDYHKKAVVAAEKNIVREALAKRKERTSPPSVEVKNSVQQLTAQQIYSMQGQKQQR